MATHTRKALKIEDLQAKHFIAWLRKQVRNGGRHTSVGYIGDHYSNPVEMYLQELTGERVFTQSCEAFAIGDAEYYFSDAFQGFSICVLEGDVDELPVCGYREVTAWEMLQTVLSFMDEDAYLVERPEVAQPVDVDVQESYVSYSLTHLSIDEDEKGTFANVPSEQDRTKTYRVDIDESNPFAVHATDCACDDRHYRKAYCKHMQILDLFYQRILNPYAARLQDKSYTEAVKHIQKVDNDYASLGQDIAERGTLNGNRIVTAVAAIQPSLTGASLAHRGLMR